MFFSVRFGASVRDYDFVILTVKKVSGHVNTCMPVWVEAVLILIRYIGIILNSEDVVFCVPRYAPSFSEEQFQQEQLAFHSKACFLLDFLEGLRKIGFQLW